MYMDTIVFAGIGVVGLTAIVFVGMFVVLRNEAKKSNKS